MTAAARYLLGREMIVDAGTLDAHVGCNLSKTEAVEAALPHSPLSGVHDGGGDVTHWVCSRGYLSIGRLRKIKDNGYPSIYR